MANNFIEHRAKAHEALHINHLHLAGIMERLGIVAVSGDVCELRNPEQFGGFSGEPSYWPVSLGGSNPDAGVIELRDQEGHSLARLTVQTSGFYGVNSIGEGNHDWNATELQAAIEKVMRNIAATGG